MEQLNNSQRKKKQLDGGERMRETLLYRPFQEYKKFKQDPFMFSFFVQSQIPPAEIIMSRAH